MTARTRHSQADGDSPRRNTVVNREPVELNDRWMCPTCQTDLVAALDFRCPVCKRRPVRDGKILDFRHLTPQTHIGLADTLADIHNLIGHHYSDQSESWRVKHTLSQIRRLPRGRAVLEIGGANGAMTQSLESLFERVISIDHSPSFMAAMIARTQRTTGVLGDALYLPLASNTVDFVVCTEVLEHVVVPTQLLLEIRRVLKPQGLLYLTVPNCGDTLNPFRAWLYSLENANDTHVNFYGVLPLQHVMARSGFEIRSVRAANPIVQFLRLCWRRPWRFRHVLAAWGSIIECVARPGPDPIPYWQRFISKHAQHDRA